MNRAVLPKEHYIGELLYHSIQMGDSYYVWGISSFDYDVLIIPWFAPNVNINLVPRMTIKKEELLV